jgi:hypothetical protein
MQSNQSEIDNKQQASNQSIEERRVAKNKATLLVLPQ